MITEFNSSLTVTGVIATLISVVFAGASFVISHRRKAHQHAATHPHSPAPAQHAMSQDTNFHPQPSAMNRSPELATRSTSSPLFKRLGRGGEEQASAAKDGGDSNQLIWE